MTHNKLSKVRHLAVALVLGNLALIALLAAVLPESALAALPVLSLMLPLLSAAAVEGALSKQPTDRDEAKRARLPRMSFGRSVHQAA